MSEKKNAEYYEAYRKEFPVVDRYLYLDHAGVAPLSLRVKSAVETFLAESVEGGAFHYPKWAQQVADTRKACARFINAEPEEIAFVKSTSHGLSLVAEGLSWKAGDNMLVYGKEFPSNLYPWMNLERKGVEIRTIPTRGKEILLEDIEQRIDSRTRLLAISAVQFSNGFRVDLKNAGELCRSKGVLLCVDAIQSLGVIPMDVRYISIDFLAADGHKWLLGPEGVGIFFCKRERVELLHPPLIGWKSVQREFDFDHPDFQLKTDALRFEEGSMNLMGIFGLGAAIDLLTVIGVENIEKRVLELGDLIIGEAEKRGFDLLTPKMREFRGGNITFSGGFDPVKLKELLRGNGIMVNARGGGLRVSPHFYNTAEELRKLFVEIDGLI